LSHFRGAVQDISEHYATLNERHEVHVRFYVGRAQVPEDRLSDLAESLVEVGFDKSRFSKLTSEEDPTNGSDVYFLDGLRDEWRTVAPKLPREKVVVCSSGSCALQDAKREGYHTLEKEYGKEIAVEEAIAQVLSR